MIGIMIFSCVLLTIAIFFSFSIIRYIGYKQKIEKVSLLITAIVWAFWWFTVMAFFNRLLLE